MGVWALVVRGSLTIDLGIGRNVRALGPLTHTIAAPRDVVFDVISGPYLARAPRALESKLRVVAQGEDMVLAEHFIPVGPLVATTLETVQFDRPGLVRFRLVRGPVPHVSEEFSLSEEDGVTTLEYNGQLGTDLWALGRLWGRRVGRRWEAAVRASLGGIAVEAERRASRRAQPGSAHSA